MTNVKLLAKNKRKRKDKVGNKNKLKRKIQKTPVKKYTAAKKIKQIAPPKLPPLLDDKCAVSETSLKPSLSLPPECAIETPQEKTSSEKTGSDNEKLKSENENFEELHDCPIDILESSGQPLKIQHAQKNKHLGLTPRQSFWLGVFFGITIMTILGFTAWSLVSVEIVHAFVSSY